MTEEQWLTDRDPERWLYPERAIRFSERKLRLFCVATCRRIWALLPADCQMAVEIAEAYADGRESESVLMRANESARRLANDADGDEQNAADAAASSAESNIREHTFPVSVCASRAIWATESDDATELAAQAELLREVLGNPFRPVAFDPAWRTADVRAIAEGVYAERAFDRLPILADALQDAGCDSEALLNHLRDTTAPHVRGCWVLDLVLGKE